MAGDPHEHMEAPVEGSLSELGQKQADALGKALENVDFDAVYSSPLGRAIQTAQAIADPRGLPIKTLEWLIEWRPSEELLNGDEANFEAMMESLGNLRPENTWKTIAGEGVCEMANRIIPGLQELLASHGVHAGHGGYICDDPENDTRIALFAHGGSLGVLLPFLLGVPLNPMSPVSFSETGVAVVEFTQRLDVWYPVLRVKPPYGSLPE